MKKLLHSLVAFTLVFGAVFTPVTPVFQPEIAYANAPTDYVSCWNFDETSGSRIDSNTTNSNDLTDVNTVLSAAGKFSNAADFEETNNEVLRITDANQVGLDNLSEMTIMTWVNFESVNTANREPFFSRWGASNTGFAWWKTDSNNMELVIGSGSPVTFDSAAWTPSNSTWYHVAVTYKGSTGDVKFYVNGAQIGTTQNTVRTTIPNVSTDVSIGERQDNGENLDGLMDVMVFYNRELTSTEISDWYNTGTGAACDGVTGGGGGSPVKRQSEFFMQ